MKLSYCEGLLFPAVGLFVLLCAVPAFSQEGPSCDISDAPKADLSEAAGDIERRVDALEELQVALFEARKDLLRAADREEAGIALESITSVVKSTSAIALTAGGALVSSPEMLAIGVVNNTAGFIVDAVNSSSGDDEALKGLLSGYATSNIDLLMSQALSTLNNNRVAAAWSGVGLIYTTIKGSADLIKVSENKNALRSQVRGIQRQIGDFNKKINVLKKALNKLKGKIRDTDKKSDKDFIRVWKKYTKDNESACSDMRPVISSVQVKNDGSINIYVSYRDANNDAQSIFIEYSGIISGTTTKALPEGNSQKEGESFSLALGSCPSEEGGNVEISVSISDKSGNKSNVFKVKYNCVKEDSEGDENQYDPPPPCRRR